MKLNLGCLNTSTEGFVNVDIVEPADVVWDLRETPWPWEDQTVELIAAYDILEHMPSFVSFMNECHRVLRPGGMLDIIVPIESHGFWIDPTHIRPYTAETFTIFCTGAYEQTYLGLKGWTSILCDDLPRVQTPAVRARLVK